MKMKLALMLVGLPVLAACSTVHFDNGAARNANQARNDCMAAAPMHGVMPSGQDVYMRKCMDAHRSRPSAD